MSITAIQTRYNLADIGTKSLTASRVRFLLSLLRFFTGNPDSHEAVGLQEQAEQLDIEALQVLRALCRDSEFQRHDRSVLRSLVDSVHGSNSSSRYFNNSPTRNYNVANNNRSCMFALLVSSFLTGSTATSPTTSMEQGPSDPFAGIRSWLLQLLSHLAVVLFTFAVWWCAKKEKEEEKVEKRVSKGKTTKRRKYRRNRSLRTTSSQEATQEEDEENEEQEEESKPEEEEKPSSSKEKARKFESKEKAKMRRKKEKGS